MTWLAENGIAAFAVLGSLAIAIVTVLKFRRERLRSEQTSADRRAVETLESLPFAVIRVGSDDRIVLANEHAGLMTKYSRGQLVGLDVNLLVPRRFRGEHPSLVKSYRRSPRTRPMGTSGRELHMVDKFGEDTRVVIFLRQMPPIDNGPETLAVIISFDEITKMLEAASHVRDQE